MKELFTKKERLIPVVVLFIGLVSLTWFRGDFDAVNGYDFATSLKPLDEMKRALHLWDERLYAGYSNVVSLAPIPYFLLQYICQTVAGSLYGGQMIFFYILFVLPGLSMFYFLSSLEEAEGSLAVNFLAPLFYMLNTFVVVKWNRGELITLFAYGLLPVYLGLIERVLRYGLRPATFVTALVSIPFLPVTIGHPADFLIVSWFLFTYTLWRTISRPHRMQALRRLALLAVGVLSLSLWWIVPIASSISSGATGTINFEQDYLWLVDYYSSWASLLNVMKMWFFSMYTTNVEFSTQFYRPGTLLYALIAFSCLFFRPSGLVLYFSVQAVIGLWLSKGTHEPFPEIYRWLYNNVPFFFIFRAPSRYFPLMYTFPVAVLFGFSVRAIYSAVTDRLQRLPVFGRWLKAAGAGILTFLIIFHAWPLFSRDTLFRTVEKDLMHPSVFIKIPPYYERINSYFKQRKGYFRVHSFHNQTYLNYTWGYSSTDIQPKLIEFPQTLKFSQELVIGDEGFHRLVDTVDRAFWGWDFARIDRILGLLSVRYITVTRDVLRRYLPDTNYYEILDSVLTNGPGIRPALRLRDADVYEIEDFLPHIFTSPYAKAVLGGPESLMTLSLTDYLKRPALIFVDDPGKKDAFPEDGLDEIVIVDANLVDIFCRAMARNHKLSATSKGANFSVPAEGGYTVWMHEGGGHNPDAIVRIDGKRPLEAAAVKAPSGVEWKFVGLWNLTPGVHRITVDGEADFVIAESGLFKNKLRASMELLSSKGLPLTHIMRLRQGYIDGGNTFSIYTDGGAHELVFGHIPYWSRRRESLFKEDFIEDADLEDWRIIDGKGTMTKDRGGIRFVPAGSTRTLLAVHRIKRPFDPEAYPYLGLDADVEPSGGLSVDITLGIDLDSNGVSDAEVKLGTFDGRTLKREGNISDMLKKMFGFPGRQEYRPLWIGFYIRRKEAGEGFSFRIRGLEFYRNVPVYKRAGGTGPDGIEIDGRYIEFDTKKERFKTTLTLEKGFHRIRFVSREPVEGEFIMKLSKKPRSSIGPAKPVKVAYRKISPTLYEVDLQNPSDAPFWLVFTDSFHQGWIINREPAGGGEALAGEYPAAWTHAEINGYANGWRIDGVRGGKRLIISFDPQRTLKKSAIISASTAFLLFTCMPLYFSINGRKREDKETG